MIPLYHLHQVFNNCAMTELQDVAYYISSLSNYLLVARVHFPEEYLHIHIQIMKHIGDSYFTWTYIDSNVPLPSIPSDDPDYGVCVDQHMLNYNLYMRHILLKVITEWRVKSLPLLSPAFCILPRMIIWWNYTKEGVDIFFRTLKNYKPFINIFGPNIVTL